MLLVMDGLLLTFNPEDPVIYNGGVLIEGEEIVAVGKGEDLKEMSPTAQIIEAKGGIIMPGLINAHLHLYSSFARGMDFKVSPPKDFEEILKKIWWPLDRNLTTEKDLYYSAIYGIIEGIENGTTALFDHHASFGLIEGSLDILKEAVCETGIRASLCFESSDRHGPKEGLSSIHENIRFLEGLSLEEKRHIQGMFGLHASFTLEDSSLEMIGGEAKRLGAPCHIHIAEDPIDVRDSLERGFSSLLHRLHQFQILQPNTLAIHGVALSKEELRELKERGCYLIFNPQSNMSNGVGAPALSGAADMGLPIGLGTDGYTTDMFESLKAAHLLSTHEGKLPGEGMELSRRMLFETNAELAEKTFGLPLGRLLPGYGADLIVIDYSGPTPIAPHNYFSHLLMGVMGPKVRTTIGRGQVLMEDREWKAFDGERIKALCREQAADFWSRF